MRNKAVIQRFKADRERLVDALTDAGATVTTDKHVRCPFHADENPSAEIRQHDGRWWFVCRACTWNDGRGTGDVFDVVRMTHGCSFESACERLGIENDVAKSNGHTPVKQAPSVAVSATNAVGLTDSTPATATAAPSPPKRVYSTLAAAVEATVRVAGGTEGGQWSYQNNGDKTAMVVVRIDTPTPDDPHNKTFRPLHPVGDGWAIGDPPGPLPLYRLDDLGGSGTVYPVEGEKCVEAARSIGLTATCSAHGANSPGKSDWSRLAGREVVILPDNDKPGANYAESVARILVGLTPPARVRIVELPGLGKGDDIADFIAARECLEPEAIRREIESLADTTPFYVAPTENAPPTDSAPAPAGPPWMTITDVGNLPTYGTGLVPITTGYEVLDDALRGGFRPGSLYVVAGRTGSAKSTLALNHARRIALAGHSVLVLKLEESITEAVWRLHAAASQVDFRTLMDGARTATGDDRQRLVDGWSLIRTLPIRLSACRDLVGIQRIAREHFTQGGNIIIIDQLSMVSVGDGEVGFVQATLASNALRLLAVELHVPILLVCQVNRPASKNAKEHLTCHDLRDSGAIENDATAVILIDKVREPEQVWRASEPVRELDIIIGKNRYGSTTDPDKPLTLTWFPRSCRIEEPERPTPGAVEAVE